MPRWSQLASQCIIGRFISFTVHRIHSTDEEGYLCTHLSPLAVDSIEKARGYSFEREDQQIYLSKDLLEFTPRWQWPEIQLPVPQVIPQAEAPPSSANQELLRGLQSTHDSAVDLLHTQNIDACKAYKKHEAASILAHIRPQDTKCRYCGRVCKTSHKLKNHIRSHHLKEAAFKCPVCNKSFGASYALQLHKKSHQEGGRKFLCAVCGMGFVSKSQVNEHTKRHAQRRVFCAHCAKSFADKRTLLSHLKICTKCPPPSDQVRPQAEEEARPHNCDRCFRRYVHRTDLMRHLRQKHPEKC